MAKRGATTQITKDGAHDDGGSDDEQQSVPSQPVEATPRKCVGPALLKCLEKSVLTSSDDLQDSSAPQESTSRRLARRKLCRLAFLHIRERISLDGSSLFCTHILLRRSSSSTGDSIRGKLQCEC